MLTLTAAGTVKIRMTVPCSEAVASSFPSRLKLTATTLLRQATTLFSTFKSSASYKMTCQSRQQRQEPTTTNIGAMHIIIDTKDTTPRTGVILCSCGQGNPVTAISGGDRR